jgi:hypothetical protein
VSPNFSPPSVPIRPDSHRARRPAPTRSCRRRRRRRRRRRPAPTCSSPRPAPAAALPLVAPLPCLRPASALAAAAPSGCWLLPSFDRRARTRSHDAPPAAAGHPGKTVLPSQTSVEPQHSCYCPALLVTFGGSNSSVGFSFVGGSPAAGRGAALFFFLVSRGWVGVIQVGMNAVELVQSRCFTPLPCGNGGTRAMSPCPRGVRADAAASKSQLASGLRAQGPRCALRLVGWDEFLLFTADFSSDDCSRTVMDTNGLNNQYASGQMQIFVAY